MSTKAVATTYTTGQTLYWYPVSRSLADWTIYRVAATESIAPNLGRYTATLDTDSCDLSVDTDCVFALFVGASQPGSFDSAIQLASAKQDASETSLTTIQAKTDLIGTLSATVPVRSVGSSLQLYKGETQTIEIATTTDISGQTLVVNFVDRNGTTVASVADGSLTKTSSLISFACPSAVTTLTRYLQYTVSDTSTGQVYLQGFASIDSLIA